VTTGDKCCVSAAGPWLVLEAPEGRERVGRRSRRLKRAPEVSCCGSCPARQLLLLVGPSEALEALAEIVAALRGGAFATARRLQSQVCRGNFQRRVLGRPSCLREGQQGPTSRRRILSDRLIWDELEYAFLPPDPVQCPPSDADSTGARCDGTPDGISITRLG